MRSWKSDPKKSVTIYIKKLSIKFTRWNGNQMTASAIFAVESIDKTSQYFSSSILVKEKHIWLTPIW